jgi:hypothetical protein
MPRFRSLADVTRACRRCFMLDRIGVLGFLGSIVFIAWAIGWIVFGFHEGLYHLWFAVAVVLMIAQGVRRVAR